MKSLLLGVALATLASTNAHYVIPEVFHNDVDYGHWEYVRHHGNKYVYNIYGDSYEAEYIMKPEDVQSNALRCGFNSTVANKTLSVKAGDILGFYVNYKAYGDSTEPSQRGLYHPGPLTAYMGRVPEGKTAMDWDGSGLNWFKIYEDLPHRTEDGTPLWPNFEVQKLPFEIPRNVPDGEYLFRVEHMNVASLAPLPYDSGAQLYLSCAQISVTGGGTGTPGPLTAIPGHFDWEDPIIHTSYYQPDWEKGEMAWEKRNLGPAVWNGS